MRQNLGIAVVIAIIIAVLVGFFLVKRMIHWSVSYEGAVQQEICQMVKAEHLTDYGVKECK